MELLLRQRAENTGTIAVIIFLSYLAILLAWGFLSYGAHVKALLLPAPHAVLRELLRMLGSGEIFGDVLITLSRLALGFVLSLLAAIPLGMYAGLYRKGSALLSPVFVLRYIPYYAIVPASILWFGIGESQKIFIIFMAQFTYFFIIISDRVAAVPGHLIDTAYALGAKNREVITKVILPYCAPAIYQYGRVIFAIGWVVIIFVEMVGADSGLGHMMIQAQRYLQMEKVYAGIAIIGLLGFLTDALLNRLYLRIFPWRKGDA